MGEVEEQSVKGSLIRKAVPPPRLCEEEEEFFIEVGMLWREELGGVMSASRDGGSVRFDPSFSKADEVRMIRVNDVVNV